MSFYFSFLLSVLSVRYLRFFFFLFSSDPDYKEMKWKTDRDNKDFYMI